MSQAILSLLFVVVSLLGALAYARLHRQREEQARHDALSRRRSLLQDYLRHLDPQYAFRTWTASVDGTSGLGFASDGNTLVIVNGQWHDASGRELAQPEVTAYSIGADQLVGAEVVQHAYVQADRSGKSLPMARSVDLKVFVADVDAPVVLVCFLDHDAEVGSDEHRLAQRAAYRWEGLVRALQFNLAPTSDHEDPAALLDRRQRAGELSTEEARRERARAEASRLLARSRGQRESDEPVNRARDPRPNREPST